MKSLILSSVAVALLVFSGCSSKEPAVDSQQTEEVKVPTTEEVSSGQSTVNSNSDSMVRLSADEVEKSLPTIYFDFDKYEITSQAQAKIAAAAKLGNNGAKAYSVKLEGNCDEFGSDEYNFALGLKRAEAVKKALVAEGIDASRISMVSYGESNPACTDKTKGCYAQNRRVNFKLLP